MVKNQGTKQRVQRTHFVRNGTLQNARSTRPRVVVGFGKSAHEHIVRLVRMLDFGQFDFGQFDFGQLAEIELAVEINWPKSKLIGRSRN